MSERDALSAESWVVHAGRERQPGAPLNMPIVPASNFVDAQGSRAYSRDGGTPSWEALEEVVAGLEGDGHGVAFASGMGAIAAVFSLIPQGARVVLPRDCYHATVAIAEQGAESYGWQVTRLDGDDTPAWIEQAASADLLWLETPSNPCLVISDLMAIGAAPRRPGALLAVDNTFATPLLQRPLALGADFSVQSATKYLGGHSDLLAGVATARDPALAERLRRARKLFGATPGALEAFLTVRGIRTLALRVARSQSSAALLAEHLAGHPGVQHVRYPGLANHPQHALAREQLGGFGSVATFEVRGGAPAADAVCQQLRLITHATSLGAVESTIERRGALAGQSHLPPGLLRLSVGIEEIGRAHV